MIWEAINLQRHINGIVLFVLSWTHLEQHLSNNSSACWRIRIKLALKALFSTLFESVEIQMREVTYDTGDLLGMIFMKSM